MDCFHTTRDASIVLSSVSMISSPPHQNHISAVLSYSFASRATASLCIHALTDRLHTTRDASIVLSSVTTISCPPHQNHIFAVLSYGFASRATASLCIHALMDCLHTTRDASVALKCLITVHNIIKRGSFILQDQLSVCPKYGGKTNSPSVNITVLACSSCRQSGGDGFGGED